METTQQKFSLLDKAWKYIVMEMVDSRSKA